MPSYAYRKVTGTINNLTNGVLRLVEPVEPFLWGQWVDGKCPDELRTIPASATVHFSVESQRFMTGCEGRLLFDSEGGRWELYWNNPFIATHNTYTQTFNGQPQGSPANNDDTDDDVANVYYTLIEDPIIKQATQAVVIPPTPPIQAGTSPTETESHHALQGAACAFQPSPPWQPMHYAEADENRLDYYAPRTCLVPDLLEDARQPDPARPTFTAASGKLACYFPSTEAPENRVVIYFTAGRLKEFGPMFPARAAAERTGWILFMVDCSEGNIASIRASQIVQMLNAHGYEGGIQKLRLIAHSRGMLGLFLNTKNGRGLISTTPVGDEFPASAVDRVISLEGNHSNIGASGWAELFSRFPRKLFVYYGGVTAGFESYPDRKLKGVWVRPATATLEALGAARIFEALPLWRMVEFWVDDMRRILPPEPKSNMKDAITDIGFPPLGEPNEEMSLSSHTVSQYAPRVASAIRSHGITSTQDLRVEAARVGSSTAAYVLHNWSLVSFFHEIMAEKEPQTDP